jgi:hypothetical protein
MLPITHSDRHCFAEFFIGLEAFPAEFKTCFATPHSLSFCGKVCCRMLIWLMAKAGWSVAVVGALVLGIWVANTSWRSRKQIWQIQSALIGGSVGFVAGRLTSKKN